MTIHQSSTLVGVERNNIRPGSTANASDVAQACEDQAHMYERITGLAVPGGSTIEATGHDHSAAGDGNTIPIPICQAFLGAQLAPNEEDATVPTWSPFVYFPVFIPAGVSKILVTLFGISGAGVNTVRLAVRDTSELTVGEAPFKLSAGHWSARGQSNEIAVATAACTAGAVNLIRLEAFDSAQSNGVSNRAINSFAVHAVTEAPIQVPTAYVPTLATPDEYNTPADFQGVDDGMTGVDRAYSSYLAMTMAKNDQVLFELASGYQSGNKTAPDVAGHNHGGGTVADGETGAGIDATLGAWIYGVARAPNVALGTTFDSTRYMVSDHATGATGETWSGRIHGVTYNTGTGSDRIVGKHRFRIPVQTDANLGLHPSAASKIKVAIICRTETSSGAGPKAALIKAQILDDNLAAGSTSAASVINVTGGTGAEDFAYGSAALQIPDTLTGDGDSAVLQISMNSDKSGPTLMLYGVCVYYEA